MRRSQVRGHLLISLKSRALCREHLSCRIKQFYWVQQALMIATVSKPSVRCQESKPNSMHLKEEIVRPELRTGEKVTGLGDD
jgi:hypothetical protein